MKRTLIAVAAGALLLTGCSSPNETGSPTAAAEPTGTATNQRDAVSVALGQPATIPNVVDITDTSFDDNGCATNEKDPTDVTKVAFNATVKIYDQTQIEWLWPSDFDYIDAAGKIQRNFDVSDNNPCRGGSKVIDLPPNSSADARVTLDVPNDVAAIGYTFTVGGVEHRVEWVIPEDGLPS